jgi:diguanylate cyclase (GGDEF)-like protein
VPGRVAAALPDRERDGQPPPGVASQASTNGKSAAWPTSEALDLEHGLELVARCLAERLGADATLISVLGEEGRLEHVRAGTELQASPWDGGRLARRALDSAGALVERFPGRDGPGDLACVVAAPIRTPNEVAGAVCAGFREPPPQSDGSLIWLIESHATLAGLCLEEPGGFRHLLTAALVDGLTGCLNYSRLKEALEEEINRCRRHHRELSCCFVDLDEFKSINELYGHPGGNRVLRVVGRALTAGVRSCDVVGRYGGDEFVIVLPESNRHQAARLGRRLRSRIERDTSELVGETVTASIGVSQWKPAWSADELLQQADAALAEAKELGVPVVVAGHAEGLRLAPPGAR